MLQVLIRKCFSSDGGLNRCMITIEKRRIILSADPRTHPPFPASLRRPCMRIASTQTCMMGPHHYITGSIKTAD